MAESTNLKTIPIGRKSRAELDAELEQLAHEQNVQPFDFDRVFGMGKESWSDQEFAEFEEWLRDSRQSEKESSQWRS